MKFTLEFGGRGKHSLRKQNEALQECVYALTKELGKARGRVEYLTEHNEQIVAELNRLLKEKNDARSRLERNRQALDAVTKEMPVVAPVIPIKNGGKARFQLIKGGLEL